MNRLKWFVVAAAVALVVGAGLTVPGLVSGGSGSASCGLVVDVDGQRYVGAGELLRQPPLEEETIRGTIPVCDDTGGNPWWQFWVEEEHPERVEVGVARGVDPARALVHHDSVLVPDPAHWGEVPEELRPYLQRARCNAAGPLVLRGTWLSVETAEPPRFDGDVRPPLTVELRVEDAQGQPGLTGARVLVRDRGGADPALTPDDVRTTLWEGGTLEVSAHCDGRRFVADGFRSNG